MPAHRPSARLPSAHPQPSVEQELLEEYAKQGFRVPIAVLLSAFLIVSMAWQRAPLALSLGWLLAVAVVLIIRGLAQRWLPRATHVAMPRRMAITTVISAMGGITHGSSVMFWPYLGDLERAVQSAYVLALSSGAVAAVIGYLPVFVAYMVPMMVPLTIQWVSALAHLGDRWYLGPAAVILLLLGIYAALLVTLARDTFRHYKNSFDSRRRMREALDEAEAANRAKTRFLASASHDLRQPMHTLTLFGAALTMMPLDERASHIAKQMNLALQGLSGQLDALLDVSKLDAGVVSVNLGTVSVQQLLWQLAQEFDPAAGRKGLRLEVRCPEQICVLADPLLLERILRNLIDNAIKYTEVGGLILEASSDGQEVSLRVIDTGIGIPEAEQERVFEEFYQLGNPERNRILGLGLGLSIVRRLADLMQLDMRLRSGMGVGTEIQLCLPASPSAAPVEHGLEGQPSDIAGLHVLVVDDEDQVRQGMQALLETMGCEVATAADAKSALAVAMRRCPDLALVDFRLRGQEDGVHVVQQLRTQWPDLPALLISGDTAPERLREASAAGLSLLHKPVLPQVMVQAMRKAVGRTA